MSERLQKFLARAGVASRRHAEELITAGRVTVNNQRVTELGTKVEPTDLVTVDGTLVTAPEHTSWYLLHKPPGVVTTLSDPEGRPTVAGFLDGVEQRVFPVGRLDWDAEGALLLTNDGGAAHRLLHPSFEVPRTYLVKVKGAPTDETLARLAQGVRLEDGPARALRAERFEATERNTWLLLQVGEGRPHLVKRLCAAVGHPVVRLFRPAQAGISVAGLQSGELRPLTAEEIRRVEAVAAGEGTPEPAPFLPPRRHGRASEDEEPLEAGTGEDGSSRPTLDRGPRGAGEGQRHRPPRERSGTWAGGRGGARAGGKNGARRGGRAEQGGFRPRGRDLAGGRSRSGGDDRPSFVSADERGRFGPRDRRPGKPGRGDRPSWKAGEGAFGSRGREANRPGRADRPSPAAEGELRPRGRDTNRVGSGDRPPRRGEGFRPRSRDSRPAGKGEFRPRGRETNRVGSSDRPPRRGEGFRPRSRDEGFGDRPSRPAGEGGFRPRGRDSGPGGRGGRPSFAAGGRRPGPRNAGEGNGAETFRPRGRDGGGGGRPRRGPGEGGFRSAGRGAERGGRRERSTGPKEGGFRPRPQRGGRGDRRTGDAGEGGFRPRGRAEGRGGARAGGFDRADRAPTRGGFGGGAGRGFGNRRGGGRFGALPRGGPRRPRSGPPDGGGGGRGGGRR